MSAPRVTLYTRAGCHLCEAAEAVLRDALPADAELRLVDIDADSALTARYTVRVPVVELDGVEVAEYEVDAAQLRAMLQRSAGVE